MGKHSRFLFLGMCAAIERKLANNDSGWFKKFTLARPYVEKFLLEHKSVIGIVLQNLGKKTRTPKMKSMFEYLVAEGVKGVSPGVTDVFKHIGVKGRVYDITTTQPPVHFTDEVKAQIAIRAGVKNLEPCPICKGYLDPHKSVSYDHITPVREGGLGEAENGQMVHPYCNTAMKN